MKVLDKLSQVCLSQKSTWLIKKPPKNKTDRKYNVVSFKRFSVLLGYGEAGDMKGTLMQL